MTTEKIGFQLLQSKRSCMGMKPRKVSEKNFDSLNWAVKKTTNINNRTTVVDVVDNSVLTYYYE